MPGEGLAGDHRLPSEVVIGLGLDSHEARRVESGKVNQVFRCSLGGAPVAVRRSPWFRTIEEVRFEAETLTALGEAGAPVVTPATAPVVVESHVWVAFEWAPGIHPDRPVHDPTWYGRLLAGLHNSSARAAMPADQRPGWCPVAEFLGHRRAGGSSTLEEVLPVFEAEVGERGTWFRRVAEQVHDRLSEADLSSLPRGVVQGDFGPHQILIDATSDSATVIDWDFCHHDLFLADLGIGTSLARPTIDRAAAMLTGYLSVAETEPGDPGLLGDLRSAFHLNNLANQLCGLWAHGFDVEPQLEVIRERLEREMWWGPILASAMQDARPLRLSVSGPELSDLEVAEELADRASVVASYYYAAGVEPDFKPDDSPVTVADRAVESMLRETLAELRPGDAVLGEEFGRAGSGSRTWILDPIDGTSEFAAGRPGWFVQIALEEEGEINVAVVDAPVPRTRWAASRGAGAWELTTDDGGRTHRQRLRVSDTAASDQATCAYYPSSLRASVPADVSAVRWTPQSLPELVRGEIDAFWVECCSIWDHAPWVLLVEEAGGAFTDHEGGRRPDRRGGLYSNRKIHRPLLQRLMSERSQC